MRLKTMRNKITVMAALGALCLVFAMPSTIFGAGDPLADNYAVLFSGGINAGSNHDRYYEETLAMWQYATGLSGGFDVANVYVLFGDGTDPAVDRSSNVNSDWSAITNAGGHIDSATPGHLQDTFTLLAGVMDEHDYLYFWSFDHGGNATWNDNPPTDATQDTGVLCGWGGNIADDTFASWAAPFDVKHETYAFGQCFAGDMVNDLSLATGDGRFAAWAADWYEPSWGKTWAVAWLAGLNSGLFTTDALGKYAHDNDASLGSEHPGWTGDDFAYRSGFEDQYFFTATFDSGDFYEGSFYAASNQGYFAGYYENFTDEYGHTGRYDIIDANYVGIDATHYGEIAVDRYHDGESGRDYYRSGGDIFGGSGIAYFGSESGHIIDNSVDQFFFGPQGGQVFEADLAVKYNFTHYYDDSGGDRYSGTVYGPQGYYGATLGTTTENGSGHYALNPAEYLEVIPQYGQVTVTAYYDGESGNTYTRAAGKIIGGTGSSYLNSESGHIIMDAVPEYFFGAETPGGQIFEADLVAYAYDFTFTYSNSPADYFTGTLYAEPEKGYSLIFTQTLPVEQGQTGTYTMSAVTPGFDVDLAGDVVVKSYHDGESGRTYSLAGGKLFGGTGDNYLGSESGYIIQAGVKDFFFGFKAGDPFYEADLAVKYNYTLYYPNGDWYSGIVYGPQGYYGATKNVSTEIGAGHYKISVAEYLEVIPQYGKVTIDRYFDAEMKRTFIPTFVFGADNYLGSEYGFIHLNNYPGIFDRDRQFPPGIAKFYFGGGYYEADVKMTDKLPPGRNK